MGCRSPSPRAELLGLVGLAESADTREDKLSGG